MRGSVVKKNDRWYVIIEDRDPATGERKRRWHSGFRTKREAQAACNDLASAKQHGDYLPTSKQTVADFVGEWLDAIRPTVRMSTHEKYARDLRTHVVANIGFVPLDQVDGAMLNRLWAQLAVSGRRSRRPGGERSGTRIRPSCKDDGEQCPAPPPSEPPGRTRRSRRQTRLTTDTEQTRLARLLVTDGVYRQRGLPPSGGREGLLMGRFARTTIGVLVATAGVAATMATPAAADKPLVFDEGQFSEDFVIPAEFGPCDFDVRLQEEGSFKVTVFFDNDGETRQAKIHTNGTSRWGLPGEDAVVTEHWVNNTFLELAPGSDENTPPLGVAVVGNPWNAHAGAGGILVNDSGRIVFDENGDLVSVSGPHEAFFGEFDDFCAAILAG